VPVVERQGQPEHCARTPPPAGRPPPARRGRGQVRDQVPDQRRHPDQPDRPGHRRQPRRAQLVEPGQRPGQRPPPMALSTASFNGHGRARSSRVSDQDQPRRNDRLPRYGRSNPATTGPLLPEGAPPLGGGSVQAVRSRSGGGSGSSEPPQPGSGPEPAATMAATRRTPPATRPRRPRWRVAPGARRRGCGQGPREPARWAATLPPGVQPRCGAGGGPGPEPGLAGPASGRSARLAGGTSSEPCGRRPDPPDPWWPGRCGSRARVGQGGTAPGPAAGGRPGGAGEAGPQRVGPFGGALYVLAIAGRAGSLQ
jgi:hypothetical protein